MKPWQVLESHALLDRRWLRVEQQRIALPQGGQIDEFHRIVSPDWVAVLALTDAGTVVAVRQYRHGAGRVSLELPAGVIDAGETAEAAARRELLEETGHAAEDWRLLLEVATEPARHTTRATFLFARGARRVTEPSLDPSEQIEVVELSPAELVRSIDDGTLFHGVHVGAISTALRRGWLSPA
jgi:8-oxo-dGTP pyrophosphatase MutT (NUDIX family)